ncbi:hypothetical protein EVAR_22742_1 [Eumeta japonica]|uniref:Uncharacterized protein n=1 Tax=Eumeta variegata TaxID=151549 RepID=A0A4C1UT10_EUMVA|nr:hypothetical protein EVAR_22742_1 [Eumeta japonica]
MGLRLKLGVGLESRARTILGLTARSIEKMKEHILCPCGGAVSGKLRFNRVLPHQPTEHQTRAPPAVELVNRSVSRAYIVPATPGVETSRADRCSDRCDSYVYT